MEQRISLVTLGVRDLERSRVFYEQLGWRGEEVAETVFFQAGSQAVVLWDRSKLAAEPASPMRGAAGSQASLWPTTSDPVRRSTR